MRTATEPRPKIDCQGSRLVIEWDNREIPRSRVLAFLLFSFWIVWTPFTLFATWRLFSGDGPTLFLCIWLVFGYLGVIVIPATWMLRWTIERIELDPETYRHYHVGMPSWFSREWRTAELTQINFGFDEEESISTLSVRRGRHRDIVAYWARDDFRQVIFDALRDHLIKLGVGTPVVDMREEQ
ncbi:MAG: hypothetical protein AAFX06_24780 [Planctomycetota bacterium]